MKTGHVALGLLLVFVLLQTLLPISNFPPPPFSTSSSPEDLLSLQTTNQPSTDELEVYLSEEDSPPVPDALPGTGRETLVEWWNTNYDFRRKITIIEPNLADRVLEPVHVYMTFTGDTARENIIAVAYWDDSSWHEVPSQIWNVTTHNTAGTDYYDSCTVCFLLNISQNHQEIYYIYFDDTYATPPTYTDYINAIPANGPINDDTTMPWVWSNVTSTNTTNVDTIYIRSTATQNEHAAILLTDMLRGGSDWGGPCCGLIAARYGDTDAFDTNNGTGLGTNRQYMLLGEFALDPLGVDTGMGSNNANRANVAPDNPAEAWIEGAGVWILDDGPLFTRIKIVTSDGGYCNINSPWCNQTSDTVNRGSNGAAGFLNYTITYTFYWHGNSTYVNVMLDITANPQWQGAQCHVKNYGDWPHIMTFTCGSGTPGSVDAVQNRKAWYGSKYGLYNETVDGRRRDFPIEPWFVWYDDASQTGYDGTQHPTLGLAAKVNPVGWEVLSLAVSGMGDNTMLQQILREGHQGDFFIMPTGDTFSYDYTVYTSAYGTNYSETRTIAGNVNNPVSLTLGEIELYRHNILTCITQDVTLTNVTNIEIYLYNSTNDLVRSGVTTDASVLFTKLDDDTYTIVSNFTLVSSYAGSVSFTINTTQITLDHSITRGWSKTIECLLSKLTIHVVDWYDDNNLPADVQIRLINATSGLPIYNLNASQPSGIASTYLLPDSYNVSVRYLAAFRVHNQTTPIVVSGSAYTSVTIGIVATDHSAQVLPQEPTTLTYVELYQEDVTDFIVFYHDIDDDVGINVSATSIPYTANWAVFNATGYELDAGQLNQIMGQVGNYSVTFDASLYQLGEIYELQIILDADAPVDYWQVVITFRIRIIAVRTSASINQPPPFPIEAYGNISIYYFDLDHVGMNWGVNTIDGYIANNSGGLRITCNVTTYTIYELTDGFSHPFYNLEIDTSSPEFNRIGFFIITINVTWEGSPYYGNHYNQQILIQLRGKETQATTTIPETVPFGDDITFNLTYWDIDLATGIDNSSGKVHVNITTSDVPGFGRSDWTIAAIPGEAGNYTITIYTSGFPGLGSYLFSIDVTWPPGDSPYYESQDTTVRASVRAIGTDLDYTPPTNVYWTQNTTIPLFFNDTDHGLIAITGASVSCDWPTYYVVYNTYMLNLTTDTVDVGLQTVTITVSKTYYETRIIIVQFYVNALPLTVTPTVADPIDLTWGENFWVEVYVETLIGNPLTDANVTFSWTGGAASNISGPGGLYGHQFTTTTANVGVHYLNVIVNRTNCATTIASLTLNIQRVASRFDTVPISEYSKTAIVGQNVIITVNYTTFPAGVGVISADVTWVLASLNGSFTEVGSGIYNVSISTSGLVAGSYTIYVAASSANVDSKAINIGLVLTLIPSSLEPETTVINVYWGDAFTVRVYYNDTYNNQPLTGANITYYWGTQTGQMLETFPIGWYNTSIASTEFSTGLYTLTLFVDLEGYQSALTIININIQRQPTQLTLVNVTVHNEAYNFIKIETGISWTVPRGDVLWLEFNFTDNSNNIIFGATGFYSWSYGSGILEYNATTGLYRAILNLTDIDPRTYTITVQLTRQNFEDGFISTLQLTVTKIPTALTNLPTDTDLYTGSVIDLRVFYNDTYHNRGIPDADVRLTIIALQIENASLISLGNGTYYYPGGITFPAEGQMVIQVTALGGINYNDASAQVSILVSLHPLVRNATLWGALIAMLGILVLAAWLAYSRLFSLPWLVRKMRSMARTLGRGGTPSLSKRDISRISTRPDQMIDIIEPAYDAIGISLPLTVIPAAMDIEERESEEAVIWEELDKLEALGKEQKLELFEEMKRIPPKDRIWFLEDLKHQMADGTRFGRPSRPEKSEEIGIASEEVAIRRRLDKFTALSEEEKLTLVKQIKDLPPEEQEEVFKTLREQYEETDSD